MEDFNNNAAETNAYEKLLHDMHSDPKLTPEKLGSDLQAIAQNGNAEAYLQIARLHFTRALVDHDKEKGIEALGKAAELATTSDTRQEALTKLQDIKDRIIARNDIRRQGDQADIVDIAYANKKEEQDAKLLPTVDSILIKYDKKTTSEVQAIPHDSIEN